MTKKFLLAASAFGVLALAGAASANEITSARVSNTTVYSLVGGEPVVRPYPVASETIASNATRLTTGAAGHNTVAFSLEDGLQDGASYRYTFAFTGAALTTSISNSAFSLGAAAAPCFTISKTAGTGAANAASVSYDVVVNFANATCDAAAETAAADELTATLDYVQVRAAAIAPVSVAVSGGLSASNTLVGADARGDIAQSIGLASVVRGYESRIDAAIGAGAGVNSYLSLTPEPVYSSIGGDLIIGSVGYAPAALTGYSVGNAFVGFGATALPVVTSNVELTVSGTDFETLIPTGFTVDDDDASLATAANTTFSSVNVTVAPDVEDAIAAGNVTFQVTVTPDEAAGPAASAVTLAEAFSGALETIELQGTSFVAPWVQSANPNYNTVIRLSNNGSRATGTVQLALTSPLRAPTATTCTLAGVPANGELSINSTQLSTCFGDFGRGDVTVTVLSLGDDITAKLRIVNPGNIVAEQSLGRTSGNP